jgi:hypothetical protein
MEEDREIVNIAFDFRRTFRCRESAHVAAGLAGWKRDIPMDRVAGKSPGA